MRPPTTLLLHSLRRASGLPSAAPAAAAATAVRARQSSSSSSPSASASASTTKPARAQPPRSASEPAYHSRLPNLYSARGSRDADVASPPPVAETGTTDFAALDVLGDAAPPANAIEACLSEGFLLDSGTSVKGGVLLVHGEAFRWEPWRVASGAPATSEAGAGSAAGAASGSGAISGAGASSGSSAPPVAGTSASMRAMLNARGQWEVPREAWGVLACVWPKPELLVLGLGRNVYPLSPQTRRHINELGIRVDVQDSRNAAAQFNLLATERGVDNVAAALIPIGWAGKAR